MDLTINDFRRVLGDVNDGNVVFKQDGSGIEKANHGNFISQKLYNYRQVPSDRVENMRIRDGLLKAIMSSPEGKLLSERQKMSIRTMLRIGQDINTGEAIVSGEQLSRKTLKSVLDTVELMTRGEEVPTDGNTKGLTDKIPEVDKNKLVNAQIAELDSVGYRSDKFGDIVKIAKAHTQEISQLMDEKLLNQMFKQGFLGHPKKEMKIFVKESAAHIQSQIFDKLFWRYIDAIESNNGQRENVKLEYGTKENVFQEVLQQMMETYAEGECPSPHTDSMLLRPETLGRREPGDLPSLGVPGGQLETAGKDFLENSTENVNTLIAQINDKFEVLINSIKPTSVNFTSRQVNNFIQQLKNAFTIQSSKLVELKRAMYETFIKTFNANQDKSVGERQDIAQQAVKNLLKDTFDNMPLVGFLHHTDADLLDKFAANQNIKAYLIQTVANKIDALSNVEKKQLKTAEIIQMTTEAVDGLKALTDLRPLALAIAAKIGLNASDDVQINKIAEALEQGEGKIAEYANAARVKFAESLITDQNAKVLDIASTFVNMSSELVSIVQAMPLVDVDKGQLLKARDEQFAAIGKLTWMQSNKPIVYDIMLPKDQLDGFLDSTRSSVVRCERQLVELEERPAKIEQELSTLQPQLDELNQRYEPYKNEIALREQSVRDIKAEIAKTDKADSKTIEDLQNQLKEAEQKLGKAKDDAEPLEEEIESIQDKISRLNKELIELPNKKQAKELELKEAKVSDQNNRERYNGYISQDSKYYKLLGEYRDIEDIKKKLIVEENLGPDQDPEVVCEDKFKQMKSALEESQIIRGKLLIVFQCGLIDKRPEVKAMLDNPVNPGQCMLTPENFELAMGVVDELLAEYSLADLKAFNQYVSGGSFITEQQLQISKPGSWVYRDMHLDGRFDFTGVKPQLENYLKDSIDEPTLKANGGGIDISPKEHLPQEIFEQYYLELRQAMVDVVTKINQNPKTANENKLDLNLVLTKSALADENPPSIGTVKSFAITNFSDPERRFTVEPFKKIYGFGTIDPKVQSNILKSVGLSLTDLNTPAGWLKAQRLMVLVKMHSGRVDGVVEWAERVIGKPFNQITFSDLIEKAVSIETGAAIADPVDTLKNAEATIARFLGGSITISEAKLNATEMPMVLEQLRLMATNVNDKVEVKLFGKQVEISRLPNGALTAKLALDGKKTMSISVARRLDELIVQIENQIVEHANDFSGVDLIKSLPPVPKGTDLIARPREMYGKVLSVLLGLPGVNFAHLTVAAMHDKVIQVVNADQNQRQEIAKEFSKSPKTYNSAEMVEIQEKYLKSDFMTRGLVKLPAPQKVRPGEEKTEAERQKEQVHKFLAELVMNEDTWAYDEGMKTHGQRVYNLIQSYGKEIQLIKDDATLLDSLPQFLKSDIEQIFNEILKVADPEFNGDKLAASAAIEQKIAALTESAMNTMQVQATDLFGGSNDDVRKPWQKSLNELNGSDGLSQSTSQGRFTKRVLDNYFKRSDPIEKRAMLANLIRNTDNKSSQGKLVGEMLKGAGPLLQKTLQGLSASTFGPETQLALKDMKSKLLPIPDSVISAQLLELIRSSNGEIMSIEVKESLGQATVGQVLLCHIRTKEHPIVGEDVVIKILRPNVQTAVQREYELFMKIAAEIDQEEKTGSSQQRTFEGRYQTVLKEFDFTLESTNIDLCMGVYDKPTVVFGKPKITQTYTTIHSMDRHHGVPPMTSAIVLQRVEGEPVDRMLERTDMEVEALVKDMKITTQAGLDASPVTVYKAKHPGDAINAKLKLWRKRQELLEKHRELNKLVDAWFDRALFGDGVFHNDLHPGNVMMKFFDVSVIDFGNVGRLSKEQQASLIYMFAGAMSGSDEDFLAGVEKLMGKKIDNNKIPADPAKNLPEMPGLRDQLKAALTEIFSKGTSEDVLPRMLGALSTLKDFAIPIPEMVHNFAESMARIQTVVDGVYDEIVKIENISDEITVSDEWINNAKLDPKWDNVGIDFLTPLKTLVKTLGVSTDKYDPIQCEEAANTYLQTIEGNEFADKIKNQLNKVVFKMDDHGIEYLNAVIDMLRPFPTAARNSFSNEHLIDHPINSATQTLEGYLKAYIKACEQNQTKEMKKLQEDIIRGVQQSISTTARNLMRNQANLEDDGWNDSGPIIYKPAEMNNFVQSVSATLAKRKTSLQAKIAGYMGIPEKEFERAIEAMGSATTVIGIGVNLIKEVGLVNSFKYLPLRRIGEKLFEAGEAKELYDARLQQIKKMEVGVGSKVLIRKFLSNLQMKKIESCAHEFRYPLEWGKYKSKDVAKKTLASKSEEVRLVFQTNLDALKRELKTKELSEAQILYFARVAAASTKDAAFSELLADYTDDQLNTLANGSNELKLMLQYYKETIPQVIVEA